MLPRSPSSFTPFPDGRSLMLGPDKALTHREISKFSAKDAEALPKYEAMLERVADFLEPTLVDDAAQPVVVPARATCCSSPSSGSRFVKLGTDGQKAVEILTGAATPILDRWFESEQLKVTLATDAIIGAMASPSMPGTAYVLFHHVMGECNGVRGVWGYVRGGMGGISNAIAGGGARARRRDPDQRRGGADPGEERDGAGRGAGGRHRDPRPAGGVRGGRERHLPQADGERRPAGRVRGGGAQHRLRERELQDQRRAERAARLHRRAGHGAGPAAPGHDPHLARPWSTSSGPTTTPSTAARRQHPIIEATIPSVLDDTLAPEGKYVMSMFTQYFPYTLAPGLSLEAEKEKYADRCFDLMNQYAPNFKRSVIARQILSPVDLEQRFGLTGGNIMQGVMSLSSLSFMRPVPGYADYRTPVRGLYLCGAATHPGGGVMGACGYNAAREIVRDLRAVGSSLNPPLSSFEGYASMPNHHLPSRQGLARLPGPTGERFVELFGTAR